MNKQQLKTSCNSHRLELFLQGRLNSSETEILELHLTGCESCARQIQLNAEQGVSWTEAQSLLAPDEYDSPQHIAAISSLLSDEHDPMTKHQTADVLSREIRGWLDPTDDPRSMGRFAGYEIVGIVGHGGMGIVLKGFEASLNRYVAIKILAPRLATNGSARKRFAREAQAAAAVRHDNVIAIHRVDEWHSLPFLVMPYAGGISLQKRIDSDGPLSIEQALRVGVQIASGLAAAHAQGLIHRDIKPANILLEQGVERVTITDFGLARAADDASVTRTGVIAGTPQYMSPEQAEAKQLDARSDLFSLGSVLYAMATGRPPFRGAGSFEVLKRIVNEPARPMREIESSVPEWFENIVNRLLSKSPGDRPSSASEVTELLQGCLAHVQQPTGTPLPESLTAIPGSINSRHRLSIFNRRLIFNPTRKGVLAMLGTIGMTLLGMVLWQATEPPDISGQWTSDEWGTVELEAKEPGQYEGTFSGTDRGKPATVDAIPGGAGGVVGAEGSGGLSGSDKGQSSKLHLKWSRVERRFNGTWTKGDDPAGKISLRLVDDEIRGAWTTNKDTQKESGGPRLADLTWKRDSELSVAEAENRSHPETLEALPAGSTTDEICSSTTPPDPTRILTELEMQRELGRNAICRIYDDHKDSFRIIVEPVYDKRLPVREYPIIGRASLHLLRYKCTVHFSPVDGIEWPLIKDGKLETEITLYVDSDHLHREDDGKRAVSRIEAQSLTVPGTISDSPTIYIPLETKETFHHLQGQWRVTRQIAASGDESIHPSRSIWDFQGPRIILCDRDGRVTDAGVVLSELDVSVSPAHFDLTKETEDDYSGLGLLNIEGDRLILCLSENDPVSRPEKLQWSAGVWYVELQRVKFDKSVLPKVSDDLQSPTTVLNGLVSGGGIIERIEEDTVHFKSGDRISVPAGTMFLLLKHGKGSITKLNSDLLEPGMAIAYSIRDGKVEKLVLFGIVEQASDGKSALDTIKDLQLRKGNESSTSIDGRFPVRITGSDGEVSIKIGETKLIMLPQPTESVEWRNGEFKPEGIDDIEPFDYVLVQWRDNGRITFTCFASPAKDAADGAADSPQGPDHSPSSKTLQQLQGKWRLTRQIAADGDEKITPANTTWEFKGPRIVARDGGPGGVMLIELDESHAPVHVDVALEGADESGLGLLSIEDDKLILCLGVSQKKPELRSRPEKLQWVSGVWYMELQRVKPGETIEPETIEPETIEPVKPITANATWNVNQTAIAAGDMASRKTSAPTAGDAAHTISGFVMEFRSGTPDVPVCLCDAATGMPVAKDTYKPIVWSKGAAGNPANEMAIAVSDSKGNFRFENVPDGKYRLIAQKWMGPYKGVFELHGAEIRLLGAVDEITVPRPADEQEARVVPTPLGENTIQFNQDVGNNETFLFLSTAPPEFDPILGLQGLGTSFWKNLIGVNRMPLGKTTVIGSPNKPVYAFMFAPDNSPGFAAIMIPPPESGLVRLPAEPFVAGWSDGRKTPPPKLAELIEFMKTHELSVQQLLNIPEMSSANFKVWQARMQELTSDLSRTVDLPEGKSARVGDLLAADAYRKLQK